MGDGRNVKKSVKINDYIRRNMKENKVVRWYISRTDYPDRQSDWDLQRQRAQEGFTD